MQEFILQNLWIIALIALWSLPWKGIALWKAAKNNQEVWFVILLLVNTLALLEILYIFTFSKHKEAQIAQDNNRRLHRKI